MYVESVYKVGKSGSVADLESPKFNGSFSGCVAFAFKFNRQSDMTLQLLGINEDTGIVNVLWRADALSGDWRTTHLSVTSDYDRITFRAIQGYTQHTGVGIDDVSLDSQPCSGKLHYL